jgi:dolichol-phosphate mannosyltransferase
MPSPTFWPKVTPPSDWQPSLTVVLPTYNESGNIGDLIVAVREASRAFPDLEILVIDDGSPDGTAAIAQAAGPDVRVVVRTGERGLASAVGRGIVEARGDVVVVMDTDFNHQPEMIPQMVDFLRYYDLVIGSRFTVGGGMDERGRYRFSYLFNFFCRLTLRTKIQDHLSGFFAARRAALLDLERETIFLGYGDYFIRMLVQWLERGRSVLEVPVYYLARRHGESKTKFIGVLLKYTGAVLRLAFGRRGRGAA